MILCKIKFRLLTMILISNIQIPKITRSTIGTFSGCICDNENLTSTWGINWKIYIMIRNEQWSYACTIKLKLLLAISIYDIKIHKITRCTFETFNEWIFDEKNLTYSFIKYFHEDGITIWYIFTHVLAHMFNSYEQNKNPIL